MEKARAELEEELRQARIVEENAKLTVDTEEARSAKRERDAVTRALRLAKRIHGDVATQEDPSCTGNPDDSYMDHPSETDWTSLSLANQIAGTEGTLQVCRVAVSKHGIALRAKWRHITSTSQLHRYKCSHPDYLLTEHTTGLRPSCGGSKTID